MEQTITCINCPVGCRMTVVVEDGQVKSVTGNTCPRGDKYARQECVDPQRVVTAVIPVQGSRMPLSVKTKAPIPKRLIPACMEALSRAQLTAPVRQGDVVLPNVCQSGVDVIATRNLSAD